MPELTFASSVGTSQGSRSNWSSWWSRKTVLQLQIEATVSSIDIDNAVDLAFYIVDAIDKVIKEPLPSHSLVGFLSLNDKHSYA